MRISLEYVLCHLGSKRTQLLDGWVSCLLHERLQSSQREEHLMLPSWQAVAPVLCAVIRCQLGL